MVGAVSVAFHRDVATLESGFGNPHDKSVDVICGADDLTVFADWGAAEFTVRNAEGVFLAARNLLLAKGSWKPWFGVIHGRKREVVLPA